MSSQVEENEVLDPASTVMVGVVKIRDENGKLWKETAEVISVSPNGAGFYLHRECAAGRLVSMMIPAEPQMRYYDHEKELYRVWGLVQHCHKLPGDEPEFHIGVAFIGRNAPASYTADPTQSYRICGMNEDGLWKIQEAKEFKQRKDPRFYTSVNHYLAVVDAQQGARRGERTTTENISRHGAAVITTLDLNVGDRVKFISEELDFSGLAVVCNRCERTDGKAKISMQFVDSTFPINRIKISATITEEESVIA